MPPILQPSDLGLIMSYKCQCACAHCLYNCGPEWTEWISTDDIDAALEATQSWDHHFQVHITGGEPFLNPELLHYAVEAAARLSIPRYVETNAGWCVREALVDERFRSLRAAGLDAILISCSPFHAETIPPERTILAIRKAMEIFGPERLIVYLPEYLSLISSFASNEPISLDSYRERFGDDRARKIMWGGYGLISGGRAGYQLGDYTEKYPADEFMGMTCANEILFAHHSHFDLYGNYISGFCGGLSIGPWRSLPVLINQFMGGKYPTLIEILIQSGPHGLLEYAQTKYGYVVEGEFTGKCHLCVDVRNYLLQFESFDELEPAGFYEHF